MANYLLLRDNKQHGPYTFDEIKAKGLKAYDLVWVEGKSAAWRYPGEVEELKPFSPAVVEQPYDRFFKKPSQESKPAVQERQNTIPEKEKIAPVYQQSNFQPAKSNIYVTLPAAKNGSVIKEFFAEEKKEPLIKETTTQDFVKQTTYQNSVIAEKEIFSQHKGQLNTTSQYTEKKSPLKKTIATDGVKKILLIAGAIILLLGGGIFIGMSINKTPSSQQSKNNNTPAEQQVANNQNNAIPVSATVTDQKQIDNNNLTQDKPENNSATNTQPTVGDKKIVSNIEKKKPAAPKEIVETVQQKSPPVVANSDTNATIIANAHREATHRTDAAPDNETIKNTLVNMVSVSSNKYNVGTFGGISDVQLTVNNQSVHPLDLVVVEVQYLQSNKKIFKTENIYFHNIGAREAMMMEAPKSPRGIKIQSKITVINTKEPGLSYTGS